ncbi:MAG: YihA family ribosome biogenesis GTP-binding protein [Clostridiales bacterium]|nr:YihA family ribosome biogenesis GTP-binding protein [Clostridiales bacterium]
MAVNFRNTRFHKLAANIKDCPDEGLPEIVMSGKSNVGKSSLVNALADNKKLARVSAAPGKTRAVVYFNVDRKIMIADLPGYGYARVSKEIKEGFNKLADDYFTSGRHFDLVLHLIDIRHSPSKEDIGMLEYMNSNNVPYFVIFTKCDKMSRAQLKKRIDELSEEFDFSDTANIFAVSSTSKTGLDDLKKAIEEFLFGGQ